MAGTRFAALRWGHVRDLVMDNYRAAYSVLCVRDKLTHHLRLAPVRSSGAALDLL